MKKVLSYLGAREWGQAAAFFVLSVLQTLFTMTMPDYMSRITSLIEEGNGDLGSLRGPGLAMLGCAAGSVVCAVLSAFCIAHVTTCVCSRMREDTFRRIISFSLPEMNQFSASSLITRCTNDVEKVQNFATLGLQVMVMGPLMAVIALSKMGQNKTWLLTVLVTIVIIIVMLLAVFLTALPKNMKLQSLIDTMNRVTIEHLNGIRVVHAYNGYGFQKKQFADINEESTRTNIFVNRVMGVLNPMLPFFTNGMTLAIYVMGAIMIRDSARPEKLELFSMMIVFVTYAMRAAGAFVVMLIALVNLPSVIVSLKRILAVLGTDLSIQDGGSAGKDTERQGTLEFSHVTFAYPGSSEPALSDISFRVGKGQILAVIGATGSGKTTLMNLIPRLYDVTEGHVYVDGLDVRQYSVRSLREKMGYVPQKSFLFEGTISSNIDYGETEGFADAVKDIKTAAEVGQSKEFIEKKEGTYQAHVEEGGANFSGGQRQRLTISRAICRKPEFYLFDDSFSALDFKTDAELRKRLREYAADATQIIVGQRIGSIMHADQILVLEKGKIVGLGTHEELMKTCGVYQEIAASQLLSREAAV